MVLRSFCSRVCTLAAWRETSDSRPLMALSMAAALAWAMAAIINITGRPDIQSPLLRGGIRHCCDFCLPNTLILLCNNSKGRVTPATNQERYPIHQMAFWVRQQKCRFI